MSPCDLAFQAQGGDPGAQYQLGVLFLLGDQVEQDPDAAYQWLAKAASVQHAGAQSLIDSVAEWRAAAAREIAPWYLLKWTILKTSSPLVFATQLGARVRIGLGWGMELLRRVSSRRLAVRSRVAGAIHDPLLTVRRRKAVQSLHPS